MQLQCQHVAIASLLLSLNTSGWVRNLALGAGALNAAPIAYQHIKQRNRKGLTESEVMELAIRSATRQAQEEIAFLEDRIREGNLFISDELDAITSERQDHIQNLNNQIADLTVLLDEQMAEIEAREQASLQALKEREAESIARIQAEAEAKNSQLRELSQSDEEWLKETQAELEAQLAQDKQEFLEKHKADLKRHKDRIDFLESELNDLRYTLRDYDKPRLPEGVTVDQIAARRCIEILYQLDCICDYVGSWAECGYIKVRLRPRKDGLRAVNKWVDRLMFELDLAEKPQTELSHGAVQLILKPQSMVSMDASPVGRLREITPEIEQAENVTTLNYSYLKDFVEPQTKHSVNGQITQLEVDHFNYLWNFRDPPIRNQSAIILAIWGKKPGDSSLYQTARGRLYRIAQELDIVLKRSGEQI